MRQFLLSASVRGLLTLAGFGALSYKFVVGDIASDVYLPLVALMVGFWFAKATP